MKRREFLVKSTRSAAGLAMPLFFPSLMGSVFANALVSTQDKKPYFLLFRVQGGMDVTLSLDPKTHLQHETTESDIFLEYRDQDIFRLNSLALGPAASPLIPYASEIATVNGVFMGNDAGHGTLNRYISSGSKLNEDPTLPYSIAQQIKPTPLGVLYNSFRADSGAYPNIISNSIPSLLTPAAESISSELTLGYLDGISTQEDSSYSYLNHFAESQKQVNSFLEKIKTKYSGLQPSVEQAVALAFENSYSQCAEIQLQVNNLDTHSNHEEVHKKAQKEEVWSKLADIFKLFKSIEVNGDSLFSQTTFMVVTEFSRTPFLNRAKGKDHNPKTNSVLFAGYGIQGGQSVGASDVISHKKLENSGRGSLEPMHCGGLWNYAEMRPAHLEEKKLSVVDFVYPENIASTVNVLMGIDGIKSEFPSISSLIKQF